MCIRDRKIYRAGIWKPRTKPGGFEGIGVEGRAWLKEVKKETGMYVSTEVATAKHVYECCLLYTSPTSRKPDVQEETVKKRMP